MKNKILFSIYIALTAIFITGVVLNFNRYSFAGYYTDKAINIIWLLCTVLTVIWFWREKTAKIYGILLVALMLLSIIPMMIPFFGIVYYFSTADDFQQIQLDNTYRIERTRPGALSKIKIQVYKNEGLIEKQLYDTPYQQVLKNTLEDQHDPNPPIQKAKLVNLSKDSIGIEYLIQGHRKVFYHKENDDLYNL
ncbi:hypothetical protein HHL23_10595 [Chryseobacterium sp. RP-3-3]|uniref:Uncharacterized protein n=1 Tax=Chryseobacterium antibioticum TaxID=2728847 RepID=A0A7Y0FS06_9FLAO|nr:hypothetical protein [Chryseobacterium antibioticum]NML70245.1 hypothetical protein [Chryseobacterium antibioticum]